MVEFNDSDMEKWLEAIRSYDCYKVKHVGYPTETGCDNLLNLLDKLKVTARFYPS